MRPWLRYICLLSTLALPLVFSHLLDISKPKVVALFITVIILWLSELAPLAVTALLVPVLATIYGILPAKQAFIPFGDQILFLFVGVFFLSKALQEHKLDQRISYYILSSKASSSSIESLLFVLAMTCWLLSMWISNTATCAIAMPIGLGIANTLGSQLKDQITFKRLKYRILFICAFAASVGGICTPVGSPPNLIAISFLSKAGIKISFLEWMIIGIPSSVVMLIALLIILRLRYPLPKIDLSPLRLHFQTELEKLGRVSKHEKHVIACFIITIFLWIAPSALGPIFADNALINKLPGVLPMGIVALIGSLPLFILMDQEIPTLSWKRAVSIDWGTIILFGGGLCLGHILLETGLASDIGKSVLSLSGNNYFLLGAFAILLAVIASEVSSNTAASSIIIPILISSTSGNINALTIAAAYGASFGFMLPVSTPPNAIVYGTGELPLREMIKTGIFFDVIGSFIIFIFIIYFGFAF